MTKYSNVKTEVDGYFFASKAEARRWGELKLLLSARQISNLQVHPKFDLHTNDHRIATYIADFSYYDPDGIKLTVEDVKGGNATKTAVYRLKKKMLLAEYGIAITEIEA